MARIAGIELADNWKVGYALTKISGVGWPRASQILKTLKIDDDKRISDLSPDTLGKIAGSLEQFPIEGELARQVKQNVARLQAIGAYRGIRHTKNLPVHGQRTRTNARTKRGKRKTVGAFKKEALTKMQSGKPADVKDEGKK